MRPGRGEQLASLLRSADGLAPVPDDLDTVVGCQQVSKIVSPGDIWPRALMHYRDAAASRLIQEGALSGPPLTGRDRLPGGAANVMMCLPCQGPLGCPTGGIDGRRGAINQCRGHR